MYDEGLYDEGLRNTHVLAVHINHEKRLNNYTHRHSVLYAVAIILRTVHTILVVQQFWYCIQYIKTTVPY